MAFAAGSSSKKRRMEEPDQAAMLQTNFFLPPLLVTKGFTSTFGRTEGQTNRARKFAEETIMRERLRADQLIAQEAAHHREDLIREQMIIIQNQRDEEAARRAEENKDAAMFPGGEEEMNVDQQSIEEVAAEVVDRTLADKAMEDGKTDGMSTQAEESELDRTIVIHPGSQMLKIGRATDPLPIQIPNCIYRRRRDYQPQTNGENSSSVKTDGTDGVHPVSTAMDLEKAEDRIDPIVTVLREALRDRMRLTKLRLPPGGPAAVLNTVKNYNHSQSLNPVVIRDENDPLHTDWLSHFDAGYINVDDEVHVPDDAPYILKHPITKRTFNTTAYNVEKEGPEALFNDVETILRFALTKLKRPINPNGLANNSALLIVPDHCDKGYIEGMIHILIDRMGFKQVAIQQESLCATFGSGLSSACVIDIGATKTTVTCVDDGFVLNETRHLVNLGGDDITAFYTYLLRRSEFPYMEVNLANQHDWLLMEQLKIDACTSLDNLVASSLWKFQVRRKGKPTLEYQYQTYDHPVLGPDCLFEPRAIDVVMKPPLYGRRSIRQFHEENMADMKDDGITAAMELSTAHLRPPPPVPYVDPSWVPPFGVDEVTGQPLPEVEGNVPPAPPMIFPPTPVIDPAQLITEASCMPLETAVCSSLIAAEGKGPALGSAILIVGGPALTHGFGAALRWRVASIWDQRVQGNSSNIDILPPPRGLDPRAVTWRGGTVITRLDSLQDMWIKRSEWQDIGMRAYRNRVYY